MTDETFTIGEVAAQTGVSASAIRYYERRGLLPEAERAGGKRHFGRDAVRRLELIVAAKRAGLALEEIGLLLGSVDQGTPVHEALGALAARKLPEVELEIDRALATRSWLLAASQCGCDSLDACALFAR